MAQPAAKNAHSNGAPKSSAADHVFIGDGEMAQRCRDFDWAQTALGGVAAWSRSLRTTVSTLLMSRHPMFLWWGPDLVQIYNDAYRPSLGGNGRHPRALGARGQEFWTEIWDAIGPQIDSVMAGEGATWHEDQYLPIDRNGRREDVWWTYSYSPVRDDDDRIAGTLVVCQETTKRVTSEKKMVALLAELDVERSRLADVFRVAPSFLAVISGPTYVIELANDAYYRLVGHRDIIGRDLFDALPEVRDQGFEQILADVRATAEPFVGRGLPVMLSRDAGAALEQRYIDLTYQPIVSADGTISRIVAHGTDVTAEVVARGEVERLLAESEMARSEAEAARAEAEAANRTKSQFLAVMSHELRTPLNAIAGYVELLDMGIRGPVTDQQRSDFARIQMSQRHLLGLINEVLNYAKLETGTVRYDMTDVSARAALIAAEELVAPQARLRRLSLTVAECAAAVTIRADGEKVRQILVNLLSNAIKFTDEGGRIDVLCDDGATLPDTASGTRPAVAISVCDSGIGIPREKLEMIFEPFVQVRSDLTRTAEGTGLGLAISRELAQAMGGSLTVESSVGVGSNFTLTLPRASTC